MLYHLEQRPYVIENHKLSDNTLSGFQIARQPEFASVMTCRDVSTDHAYWHSASQGERRFYPLLREWIQPTINAGLSIDAVFVDPVDLPHAIRSAPPSSRLSLVVNCFPGPEWNFTTSGLNDLGLMVGYRVDSLTDLDNHRSCVPTAFRRMGIVPTSYYEEWVAAVSDQPRPIASKFIYSGHMIAVKAHSSGWFQLGDQYGTGLASPDTIRHMAISRNSFWQGDGDQYHLQVFETSG